MDELSDLTGEFISIYPLGSKCIATEGILFSLYLKCIIRHLNLTNTTSSIFTLKGVCGHTWNGGNCCFSLEDDEDFLIKVINQSTEELNKIGLENAKYSKLFFFGFSAGAVMSHRLACTKSKQISGIASISGILAFPGNTHFTIWGRSISNLQGP